MAENKSAVDDFLSTQGSETLVEKENNPFANLKVEQEEEAVKEEPKEEKPLPYHEDPKLRRYIEKEIAKATQNLTPKEEAKFREEVKETDLVGAFTKIIGNDTPEKVEALNLLKRTVDDIREEARSSKQMLEDERRADYEAERELAQGFENIEEKFNIDFNRNSKLRSEFIDFIERVAPKDEDGEIIEYPDFEQTFQVFQESRRPQNNRAKDLASRSMARSGEASTVQIPEDTSWRGVEKFFAKLKG